MAREESPFIEPKQAARMLGTHISTVYRLILHGKIPARRRGGRVYLLRKEDVIAFAEGVPVVPVPRIDWQKPEGGVA